MASTIGNAVFIGLAALSALPAFASSVDVIFYDNRFGALNDATGVYTQIGTLPVGASGGIAELNGLLYIEDFSDNLCTVDSVTGAAHLAGNTGASLSMAVFGGGSEGLFEIDYASNLYSINAANGKATLVGATGLAANNGQTDTSLSTDGTWLYYTSGASGANDEMYRINPRTGQTVDLGSTGVTGIAGSAFVDGNLELFQYGQSRNYIYSASAGSIDFISVAQLGAQIIDGGVQIGSSAQLSAGVGSVPEPGTIALLGAGVLAGVAIRRLLHARLP